MCGGSALDVLKFALPATGLTVGYFQKKKKSAKRKAESVAKEAERVKSVARAKAKDREAIQTVYSTDQSQNIIGGGGFGQ